jgi:hypothetical protein
MLSRIRSSPVMPMWMLPAFRNCAISDDETKLTSTPGSSAISPL